MSSVLGADFLLARQTDCRTTLFNTSSWQQLIAHVYGYQRFNLPAPLEGATPAFHVNSILFGRKITNMPFNFYPALRCADGLMVQDVLSSFADYCASHKGVFAELKLTEPLPTTCIENTQWSVSSPFMRSLLKLSSNPDEIRLRGGRNLAKNLNRIQNRMSRLLIEIQLAVSLQEVNQFYHVLAQVYRDRHQMICHPLGLYESLFTSRIADFYLAKHQAKVVAGIVVLRGMTTRYYAWGASLPRYLQMGTLTALLARAIEDAAREQIEEFDFGTSPRSDTPLIESKRRWGCDTSPTYYYHWGRRVVIPDLNSTYRRLRLFYRLVPVWIITKIAPIIVPHLG